MVLFPVLSLVLTVIRVDRHAERVNELEYTKKQLEMDIKKSETARLKRKEHLEEELASLWEEYEAVVKDTEETETGVQQLHTRR